MHRKNTSPKGREARRRYADSPLGRERDRRYNRSPKRCEKRRASQNTPEYRSKIYARRRELHLERALDVTRDDYSPKRAFAALARWNARL